MLLANLLAFTHSLFRHRVLDLNVEPDVAGQGLEHLLQCGERFALWALVGEGRIARPPAGSQSGGRGLV